MSESRIRVLFELDDFDGEGRKPEAFLISAEKTTLSYKPDGETVEDRWESTTIPYEDFVLIQECVNEMYAAKSARRNLS